MPKSVLPILTVDPKSFRSRKNARAELKIDLGAVENAIITLFVQANNPSTRIWTQPPGSGWYVSLIPQSATTNSTHLYFPNPM